MKKLVLMSVLIATLWIPIAAAARYQNAQLGVRKVQINFYIFVVVWVLTVLYVLPRL